MNMMSMIGHHIHFSFQDMLDMTMDEIEYFYEIAEKANAPKK